MVVLLFSACARGTATRSPSRDPSKIRASISKVKEGIVRAYVDLDARALEELYTEDFTVSDGDGKQRTKADELAWVRGAESSSLVEGRYEITDLRIYGDLVVASGQAHMVRKTPEGPEPYSYRSFNVFRFEEGRWRYAAAFTP
ncbi:MAG: nuclear transport factor 2 family protein [Myxococcota bacterium]